MGLLEVGEVFMVSEDLHWEGRAMEVVSPGLQGTDDGEKFTVINIIVMFCGGNQLGEIGGWVPVPIGVSLEEDGPRCILRGISGNGKGGGKVGKMKNRFGEEEMF